MTSFSRKKMSNDLLLISCSGEITKISSHMWKSYLALTLYSFYSLTNHPPLGLGLTLALAFFSHTNHPPLDLSLALSLLFLTHTSPFSLTVGACAWFFSEVGCVGEGEGRREKKNNFAKVGHANEEEEE